MESSDPPGGNVVVVASVQGMVEAEILRGLLEASGIQVGILPKGPMTAFPFSVGPLGMVDVMVPSRHEEAARAVLAEMRSGRLAEDAAPPSETE
jgi:hypothetical protein